MVRNTVVHGNLEVVEPETLDTSVIALHELSDRELLLEIAANLRLVGEFIRQFQSMSPGDMMKMLLGR